MYAKMRTHVLALAAKDENGTDFVVTWPVSKSLRTLYVDPSVILRAHQLGDVTFKDIPEGRWKLLTTVEKLNLKKDIWFYNRSGLPEDAGRAAIALADAMIAERAALADKFGVALAYSMDAGEEPSEKQEADWLAGRVKMSLHDWVSVHRKQLQEKTSEHIKQFVNGIGGSLSITHREDLVLMLTPAPASTIAAVEDSLGEFQRTLSALRFDPDSGDVPTGPAVVTAPSGNGAEEAAPCVNVTLDASTSQAVYTAPCGKKSQIHIPFGEDVVEHLEQVHKDASRWVQCQRKLGLFRMTTALSDLTVDDEFEHYKANVMNDWDFSDLEPEGDKAKLVWVSRCVQLLSKLPEHTDGVHAEWLQAPQSAAAVASPINSIGAILRRHHGEIKVIDDVASKIPRSSKKIHDFKTPKASNRP